MSESGKSIAKPTVESVVSEIFNVATTIAAVFPVGAEVAGAIKLAATVANGLVNAVPSVVALYDNIKAAVEGGAAPTAEQWASYNAAADTAHVKWLAAVAEARGTSTS